MPLFQLHCPRCRKDFKAFLRLSEVWEGAPCPACGERAGTPLSQAAETEPRPAQDSAAPSCSLPQQD